MEAITTYLDNMFANLPKTEATQKMKSDMLADMEEKYAELKKAGKTDNEAIGIVISEFGNMDELIGDLNVKEKNGDGAPRIVSSQEAEHYLAARKRTGSLIGLGVFLLIVAPAIRVLITQLTEDGIFGIAISEGSKDGVWWRIPFFIVMACAVGIILNTSLKFNKQHYLKGHFNLQAHVKSRVTKLSDSFNPIYVRSVRVSVCLFILSPIALLLSSLKGDDAGNYGVPILFTLIAIAAYILIYVVTVRRGYNRLLKKGKFSA